MGRLVRRALGWGAPSDTVGLCSRLWAPVPSSPISEIVPVVGVSESDRTMGEPDRPQSPFAGMADLSVSTPLRVLSPDEIEQMLAEHRLYLETEYHQGHRANFASADLTGRDFSGLNLRGTR